MPRNLSRNAAILSGPMDLSNRDIAFLVWLGVVALASLRWRPILDLARVLLGVVWFLRYAIAAFAVYIVVLVLIADRQGLWDSTMLKETLAWFVLPGIPLLFHFTRAWEGRRFYVRTLAGALGLSAIVEFYMGLGSFPLPVEIMLLPTLAFLVVIATVATAKPETRVVGRIANAVLAVLGISLVVGATLALINRPQLDLAEIARSFALLVWLTAASLPFVFVFSLIANYHDTFHYINTETAGDKRARRRSKATVLLSFQLRNRELHKFTPSDARDLARTTSWGEARRLIAYQRAVVREHEAKEDVAAKKLLRYAGVEGTDWDGQPLDQREFVETKEALDDLALFQRSQYQQHSRYNPDLEVGILVARKLPTEHGIVMKVNKKGIAWFAWRRTVTGWCLGVGASGRPPDQWTYGASEPPGGFPKKDTGWQPGDVDQLDEEDALGA